jgi:hypothetical protein
LGKALQDPIKGIAALAKSGVTFTKQEKKKIEALVESGNLLEAQNIILKAVEGQVGGTASASASSFAKMKFAIAGVSDTFGEMLLPVIDKLAPKLAAFTAWASENSTLLAVLVGVFGGLAVAILAVNVAMKVWTATTAAFTAVQAAFNAVMALNPIFLIVAAIAAIIAILVILQKEFGIFDGVIRVVGAAFGAVWQAIKTVFDWVKNNWPLLLAVLTGPFGIAIAAIFTFKNQIMEAFSLIYKGIRGTMGFVADLITAPFKTAFRFIAWLWNNTLGKLSFTMPDIPGLPGRGKKFSMPQITMLAEGGIVTQATLAMIGEGNEPEAIIPLSKLASMGFGGGGGGVTVNVTGGLSTSAEIGQAVVNALRAYSRSAGPLALNIA